MKREVKLALPHSIVMVMDKVSGNPPTTFAGNLIASTATCVAVGAMSEYDGETTLLFADEDDPQITSLGYLAFDGLVEVQGKEISLVTALNQPLSSLPVQGGHTRVRVWVNDMSEPNRIGIVIG